MARKFRIWPCGGSASCWCLIELRNDGSEIDSNGAYTTSYSLDNLLKRAGYLQPQLGDSVELVPMAS